MEVPSSKEKKTGGSSGEQEERKGVEMGKGFLMRADICGAALSSCLSQTSGCLLRAPCSRPCLDVGGFFRRSPSEQTCSRTASLLPPPDQCLSDLKGRRE